MARRFRFSLRQLFVAMAVVALLATLLTRSWHRTRSRFEYIGHRGAVNGHAPTMKKYRVQIDRSSVSGLLFGNQKIEAIQLLPGTYDEAHLEYLRGLFPEAIITESNIVDLP